MRPLTATRPAHPKAHPDPEPAQAADPVLLRAAGIAGELVGAIREQGHLDVPLDPHWARPAPGHPTLRPEFYGISEEQLSRVPAQALDLERLGETARDVLARLREIYCQRIGYEIDQLEDPAQREWLIDYIENGRHWEPLSAEEVTGTRQPADPGRRYRAIPSPLLPGEEAILHRGIGHARADAGRAAGAGRPAGGRARRSLGWRTAAASTCSPTSWGGRTGR